MSIEHKSNNPKPRMPLDPALADKKVISAIQEDEGDRVPTGDLRLEPHHQAFADFHEGYIRHYIALADGKATTFFGATAGFLAYLFSQGKFGEALFNPSISFMFVQSLVTASFLLLSACCAALVILPRTTTSGEGLVFFGSVAGFSSGKSYLASVSEADACELTSLRIQHCYDVSKVCARKYDMLRRAIWFAGFGTISSFPVLSGI